MVVNNTSLNKTYMKDFNIACIMDQFTYDSFKYECNLYNLSYDTWLNDIKDIDVDLFFIETAWLGKNDTWRDKLRTDKYILELIIYFRQKNIPIIFWSKEDPVHFYDFIHIATLVDVIFTTDIAMIPKYIEVVKHDKVYCLPFATQQKLHNPIELFKRKSRASFAGSYYHEHKERQKDFDNIYVALEQRCGIDIYDRFYYSDDDSLKFPDRYLSNIVGTLEYKDVYNAYKHYEIGVNINTVKHSPTMFARRVFELMSSGTFIISNYSCGIKTLLGDLVVSSDNSHEINKQLDIFFGNSTLKDRLKLNALRKVLSEHTYTHRLGYVLQNIFYRDFIPTKCIFVFSVVSTFDEYDLALSMFNRQKLNAKYCKKLILISDNILLKNHIEKVSQENIIIKSNFQESLEFILTLDKTNAYIAFFSVYNFYGEYYLQDLALSFSYSDCLVITKDKYYMASEKGVELVNGGEYCYVDKANIFSSLFNISFFHGNSFCDFEIESINLGDNKILSISRFDFCKNFHKYKSLECVNLSGISSELNVFKGINIEELNKYLDIVKKHAHISLDKNITISKLNIFTMFFSFYVKIKNETNGSFLIASSLRRNRYKYIKTKKYYELDFLKCEYNKLLLEVIGQFDSSNLKVVIWFYGKYKLKIARKTFNVVNNHVNIEVPDNTKYIKFGFKVIGTQNAMIESIAFKNHSLGVNIPKSSVLVLTRHYPSYSDIYKYGFLHSRIREYKKQGLNLDVFTIHNSEHFDEREFEGVNVSNGNGYLLETNLNHGMYKCVLVHFIDCDMWQILKKYLDKIKVIIWVHGAEIQVWQRREYEFERFSEQEIIEQKKSSDERVKLWHEIIKLNHPNVHFVFVSEYFKSESLNDLGLTLTKDRYSIIHNYIDSSIFKYQEKVAQDRLKILSIRPYASRKYANDLSVKAILELSKKEYFNELEFCLIGDGELFEETVKPLKNFKNVKLIKKFITHDEIAKIHKEYGIFLTPTRMDSQGVSRDEAMSSGLVSITTNVAAIPEFVDNTCSMVVEPENPKALADAIDYLYHNPDKFLELSKRGSKRVDELSSFKETILKEMELIDVR